MMQAFKSEDILSKALSGEQVSKDEAKVLMDSETTNLDDLIDVAKEITKKTFNNKVEMCGIYPAKIGRCSGDCAYCSQSVHHSCDINYLALDNIDQKDVLDSIKALSLHGAKRCSLVTSGEALTDKEFDKILEIFQLIKSESGIELCASLGSLTEERAQKLISIGVTRYHHNIESSKNYFPQICTTHTFEEKVNTINIAKQAGLSICSGGIISMGESSSDRIDMAFELKALDVDCVPINILNPIPGTKLENQKILPVDELLRTIAVFRLILPNKPLRFAGGRENAFGEDEYKGFIAGINSMIVGGYLTSSGKVFEKEAANVERAGFELLQ